MYQEKIVIRTEELEKPYSHVHHADTLKYFEKAREGLIVSAGLTLEELYQKDLFPVIRSISVDYLREVVMGNYIVTCSDLQFKGRSFYLLQEVVDVNGKCRVRANVQMMFLSQAIKRAVKLPEDLLLAILKSVGG